jgi:hypothetical protein
MGSIYGDIYLQRINAYGQIAEGWPTGGVPACRAELSQYNLALAPDGEGGVFAAWQDFRSGFQSEIYLQRITSAGTVAQGWPQNGRRVAESIGDQYSPAMAPDGNGGVTLVWEDRRTGSLRIHALAIDSEGAARGGWPPTGACLDAAPRTSDGVTIASVGPEAAVVWRSQDSLGVCRLLARRLTSGSAPDTMGSPAVVAEGTGQWISEPALFADSSGYFVAWTKRAETNGSIEIQLLSPNGSQWPTAATVTAVGAGFLPPNVVGDRAGGAFLVWDDFRTLGTTGVFAQHVSANGDSTSGWTANGFDLNPGSSLPYGAVATPDGTGGLIVSWAASDTTSLKQLLGAGEIQPLRGLRVREAKATPGRARITWQSYEPLAGGLLIERRVLPSNWEKLSEATTSDSGLIRCDDQAAPEGSEVEYRVVLRRSAGVVMFAPIRLSIPVAPKILALHWARYDATSGSVDLSFSLPRGPDPGVEFMDVAGRRMHRQAISNLDPGEQRTQIRLPSRMASGMYFMRLSQGSQIRTLKLAVVR